MAINYTTAVKSARMTAVLTAIGSAGYIEIGTTGMATVLATIPLANPAGTVTGGVLTFTMPASDLSADATGKAAAARVRASGGTDVITGLTVDTSAADIVFISTDFVAGQEVKLETGSIAHA